MKDIFCIIIFLFNARSFVWYESGGLSEGPFKPPGAILLWCIRRGYEWGGVEWSPLMPRGASLSEIVALIVVLLYRQLGGGGGGGGFFGLIWRMPYHHTWMLVIFALKIYFCFFGWIYFWIYNIFMCIIYVKYIIYFVICASLCSNMRIRLGLENFRTCWP